jgi:ribonuclease HII
LLSYGHMVRRGRYSLRWKFERGLRPEGVAVIAGVDEVGRGCWAGPVFAAAAILPDGLKHRYLNDSKVLMRECREELSHFLCQHPEVHWSIGVASLEEIEIHGNMKAGLSCAEMAIIDGDARCPSIAAASVIAKVARDRAMEELAVLYPHYGLEKHKGYGTPEHARALTLHGPCAVHRRAFKPIREYPGALVDDADGDRFLW